MARNRTTVSPGHNQHRTQASSRPDMSELVVLSNNIGHSSAANDTLRKISEEAGAAVVMMQEPLVNTRNNKTLGWGLNPCQNPSTLGRASRVCTIATASIAGHVLVSSEMPDHISTNKITWMGNSIMLVNMYLPPRESITTQLHALSRLLRMNRRQNVVVVGDWNARSELWGDHVSDERSEKIMALAAEHSLELASNDSSLPTFVHNNHGCSHIDFAMSRLSSHLSISVKTLDEITHDHRPLKITLRSLSGTSRQPVQRYNVKKANWVRFQTTLLTEPLVEMIDEQDVDCKWDMILNAITKAADKAIPKKRSCAKRVPFWTQEPSMLRAERNRARQAMQRSQTQEQSLQHTFRAAFLEANKKFKVLLKRQKTRSFADFIERESASDPWSLAYKVCRERVVGLQHLIESDQSRSVERTLSSILDHFFPSKTRHADSVSTLPSKAPDDHALTEHEIRHAIHAMSLDKAPGNDMITGHILRHAYGAIPEVLHSLYKMCFDQRKFPMKWKEAILAVVPKPGKADYNSISSYRPISLLSVPGKVLDKLMINRINHYLYSVPGMMSSSQYGFKPQNSTEQAIKNALQFCEEKSRTHYVMMIALDIKSAFDTADHELILEHMMRKGVPGNLVELTQDFFSNRTVHVIHESLRKTRLLDQGCPQGSVSGPSLWNILMDSLPLTMRHEDSNTVCFADDGLVQVRATTIEATISLAERMIERALGWCDRKNLKLNMDKTEVMLIPKAIRSKARERLDMSRVRNLTVNHDDQTYTIKCVQQFRYLGVILDQNLSFAEHISHISTKATKVISQLSRGAHKKWGFSASIMKTLYLRCVEPIVCYACSVWGHRADATLANKRKLDAVQRLMLIRATRSYRTVSHLALCAILGVMPIRTRIQELLMRSDPSSVTQPQEQSVPFTEFLHPSTDHYFDFSVYNSAAAMDATEIFTDGSKADNRVGAAFVVFEHGYETDTRLIRLANHCSVYQAELMAILTALHRETLHEMPKPISIITDSLSSLHAIKGSDQSHPIVFQIKKRLLVLRTEYGLNISLKYTKAHDGTHGNERADFLAKRAASWSGSETVYDLMSKQTVKHKKRAAAKAMWHLLWTSADVGRHTFQFLKHVTDSVPLHAINYHTTQFLTNHGSFVDYLRRFKVIEAGTCLCGEPGSNSNHVLTDCSAFDDHPFRTDLQGSMENLLKIITRPEKCDTFIDLCKEYSRKNQEQRLAHLTQGTGAA